MLDISAPIVSPPARRPFLVLRVRSPTSGQIAALGEVLGAPWPDRPNTSAVGAGVSVLWLAPGEWGLVGDGASDTARRAAGALAGATHHLSDLTEGRVVFAIAGASARNLLARGCSLDLHPRAFAEGDCAQTRFAHLPVLIHRPSDDDLFELWVEAPCAAWLTAWFEAAAARVA